MPDFATHHIFGERLDPPVAAVKHRNLYLWGLQGPDFFFYRGVLSGSPHHKTGSRLHNERVEQLLSAMASYCFKLSGEEQELAEAYMYGFAAHYALDSTVHPYVFAQQRRIQGEQPRLAEGAVHSLIESDMDADLYSLIYRDSVCKFDPFKKYALDDKSCKAVGAMYTCLLYEVYQSLLSPAVVIAALQDTLRIQKLLFSGSTTLHAAARLLDNTKGRGSRYFSSHVKGTQPQWDSLNLSEAHWTNPWTDEESCYSVPQLMDEAEELYNRLVGVLERNAHGALLRVPADKDFSGNPL